MHSKCFKNLAHGPYFLHNKTQFHQNIIKTSTLTMFLNPIPDDKILDWSKLKQIADGISKCIYNGK